MTNLINNEANDINEMKESNAVKAVIKWPLSNDGNKACS